MTSSGAASATGGVGGEVAKEAGDGDLGIFQMVKWVSSWPVGGRGKITGIESCISSTGTTEPKPRA
jgi:hypothetical protein